MLLRQAFVDAAKKCIGLSADSQAYRDFIAPGESPARQREMARMSGCGLVVAGVWREAGVVHPSLLAPYKTGEGISRLLAVAYKAKAWRLWKSGQFPQVGDMVLVGNGTAVGGIEHVYTVIGIDDNPYNVPGTTTFVTVDGGQVTPKGLQVILEKRHQWAGRRDVGYQGTDPHETAKGRVIVGWVDVTSLPDH